ncbi:MAG TPA: hypothetical protein VMT35_19455, partial [Ignavibacteriaceae bacterium]|nr:hypothetical protein [Ignavibacteriaceae bacterium]
MKIVSIVTCLLILLLFGCKQPKMIYNTGIKDYTNIFNDALSGSDYVFIKPGSYPLSAPLYLHSNLIIEGEGEVILIKSTPYSQVFTNIRAAKDYSVIRDESITIMNIIIDANNNGNQKDAVHPTANGDLSFKYLNYLTLKNIKIINGDSILFGIHLQSVKNATVKNYSYDGDKTGIQMQGGCENIKIDNFDISSGDDAFAINVCDYPRVQHNTEDSRNITIENGISRKRNNQCGSFLRLMTGSWKEWQKGNKYRIGDITNYNGKQYKKINKGELVSLDCPRQLGGDSLYSDGLVWRYIGQGTNVTSNIYNVYVLNVRLDDGRKIVRTIDADSNNYGEYPGTENTSIVDSIYTEGHQVITRGKIGVWKTIPRGNQVLLNIFLACLILLIIVVSFYFLNNKKFIKK